MILHSEQHDWNALEKSSVLTVTPNNRDVPPPYEPPTHRQYQSSAKPPSTFPAKAKLKGTTNFVTISKSWGAVEGYYLIDPSLPIPPPPLTPSENEQDRKNLKIDVSVGTINVDIGIADPGQLSPVEPVKLSAIGGTTGTVNVRVHASSSKTRPPFHLYASSNCGTVEIALPQSFHGLVKLTSKFGTSELSDKRLIANTRLVHEQNGSKLCFVGDMSDWETDDWTGDEVIVEVRLGTINVKYI